MLCAQIGSSESPMLPMSLWKEKEMIRFEYSNNKFYSPTGDMDLEELRAKYAAAYDSDFEIPQESEEETTEYEDSSDDEEEESEGKEVPYNLKNSDTPNIAVIVLKIVVLLNSLMGQKRCI